MTSPPPRRRKRPTEAHSSAVSPALAIGAGATLDATLAVQATAPDERFVLSTGESVDVRDGDAPADAPLLTGAAIELVEGLSLRAPLPVTTPPEWKRLLGGIETAFTLEPT